MSADEWAGIRVYMQDRARFQRDARAVARSTDEMGYAADRLGRRSKTASERTWLMNQAMFTLRRLVYGVTLGIGATVTAVAALGFQFNMMRETAQVSFSVLLGSSEAAKNELQFLFDLAARTPFDFPGVQQGARQLLNYGFSLGQTNRYLETFSDIVAGFGGDTTVIERIVRAFGQMHTKGRVMGQELLQLQEAGVNATQYLMEQLNLTRSQIANIGRLGLRADVAVEAIVAGIQQDPRFKGAAAALQETTAGRLTTFRDYISRLFGDVLMAPFSAFSGLLPVVNADLQELVQTLENEGFDAFVKQLDEMVNGGGRLVRLWGTLRSLGKGVAAIVQNVLFPAIKDVTALTSGFALPAFSLLGDALQFAAKHGTALKVVLILLIGRMVIMKSIALAEWTYNLGRAVFIAARAYRAMGFAQIFARITGLKMIGVTKLQIFWDKILVVWQMRSYSATQLETAANLRASASKYGLIRATRLQIVATRVLQFVLRLATAATLIYTAAGGGMAGVLALVRAGVMGVATAFYELASAVLGFLLTNPIGWAILLIAALVILYFKWDAFHKLVDRTFHWIVDNWQVVAAVVFGPWIIALEQIIRHLDTIWRLARRVKNALSGGFMPGWAKSAVGFSLSDLLPGAQAGGHVISSGFTMVGERGPEVMYTPAGSTIVPLTREVSANNFDGEFEVAAPIIIRLDSGVLAEAVAGVRIRKKARQ